MQADDDFHEIIRTVVTTAKKNKETYGNNKNKRSTFVRMTQEAIELLFVSDFSYMEIYNKGNHNRRGAVSQLRSMNFKNTIDTVYVAVINIKYSNTHKSVHIRATLGAWRSNIGRYTSYNKDTEIFLVKYVNGILAKWDSDDYVLSYVLWRKFFKTVFAVENDDPYNPDQSGNDQNGLKAPGDMNNDVHAVAMPARRLRHIELDVDNEDVGNEDVDNEDDDDEPKDEQEYLSAEESDEEN